MRPNSIVQLVRDTIRRISRVARCIRDAARLSRQLRGGYIERGAVCATRNRRAGHRSIESTREYIDSDTDSQRRLVFLL
jgi:hypothetical protein